MKFLKNLEVNFLSVLIEVKKGDNKYYCMKNHGRDNSGLELSKWIEFFKNKRNR